MASGIFGALSALGNFGQQMGEADELNAAKRTAAEKEAQAQADRQATIEQRRSDAAAKQAQANAKKPLGVPYAAAGGKMMQRFYDPVTKTITEEEIGGGTPEGEPEKYKRSLLAIGMTEKDAQAATLAKYGQQPAKLDAAEGKIKLWKSLGFTDAEIKRMEAVEGGLVARPRIVGDGAGGGGALTPDDIKTAAQQVATGTKLTDLKLSKADLARVTVYMLGHGIQPGKAATNQEKQATDAVQQLLPMVNNLLSKLGAHKDENDTWSGIKQHIANGVYSATPFSPGKEESDILQQMGFIQALGTAPWTKIGRGKLIFETIQGHLPRPGDSLPKAYQKLTELRDLLPFVATTPGTDPSEVNVGDTIEVPQ